MLSVSLIPCAAPCAYSTPKGKGRKTHLSPCAAETRKWKDARPATRVKILSRARYSRHAWCLAGARPPRSSRAISGYLSSRGSRRSFRRQVRLGLACGLASAQVVVSSVFQVISRPPRVISSRQVILQRPQNISSAQDISRGASRVGTISRAIRINSRGASELIRT